MPNNQLPEDPTLNLVKVHPSDACRNFVRGICRAQPCIRFHIPDLPHNLHQEVCNWYNTSECRARRCNKLHDATAKAETWRTLEYWGIRVEDIAR